MSLKDYTNGSIYISGPMTGLENHNSKGFYDTEVKLRNRGFTSIINPIHISEIYGLGHDYNFYMRKAIEKLMTADAVYVFGNYKNSKGVAIEIELAHKVGIPVFFEEYND